MFSKTLLKTTHLTNWNCQSKNKCHVVEVNEWLNKEKNFRALRKLWDSIEAVKVMRTAFVSHIPQSTYNDEMITRGYKSDRWYGLDLWWVLQEASSLKSHSFLCFQNDDFHRMMKDFQREWRCHHGRENMWLWHWWHEFGSGKREDIASITTC